MNLNGLMDLMLTYSEVRQKSFLTFRAALAASKPVLGAFVQISDGKLHN